MPRFIPALYRLKRPRTIGNTRNLLKKTHKSGGKPGDEATQN